MSTATAAPVPLTFVVPAVLGERVVYVDGVPVAGDGAGVDTTPATVA